jgi:hypothetical protein
MKPSLMMLPALTHQTMFKPLPDSTYKTDTPAQMQNKKKDFWNRYK